VDFIHSVSEEETWKVTKEIYEKIGVNVQNCHQPLIQCRFVNISSSKKKLKESYVRYFLQKHYDSLNNEIPKKQEKNPFTLMIDFERGNAKYLGVLLLSEYCSFTQFDSNILHWTLPITCFIKYAQEVHDHYKKIEEFESIIGIQFNDKLLIRKTFTHSTFVEIEHSNTNNETLEYLGDSLLESFISLFAFENFRDATEGFLNDLRCIVVANSNLEIIGKKLKLRDYLIFAKKNTELLKNSKNVDSDALESLIGSIFLDQGIRVASHFCDEFVFRASYKCLRSNSVEYYHSFEYPMRKKIKMNKKDEMNIRLLEEKLGFEFNNKFILLEALTHPTAKNSSLTFEEYEDTGRYPFDYERLEFLGDSILKTVYFFFLIHKGCRNSFFSQKSRK
jgi:ribonuclease III